MKGQGESSLAFQLQGILLVAVTLPKYTLKIFGFSCRAQEEKRQGDLSGLQLNFHLEFHLHFLWIKKTAKNPLFFKPKHFSSVKFDVCCKMWKASLNEVRMFYNGEQQKFNQRDHNYLS